MSNEDFDVDGLSRYLRLSPAQVTKMAERGQLPGRRIGGQWRFSAADIHHWWEDRISSCDEAELAAVEDMLQRYAGTMPLESVSIRELLPLDAIAVPLAARTRNSVITAMIDLAAGTGLLWDSAKMDEAVRAREAMQSTATDNGVALLHPRRPLASILAQPFLALGRTSQGIPFGHPRGVMTDIYFLIGSTDDRTHLRILARLSRLIGDPIVLGQMRDAPDAAAMREVLMQAEDELDVEGQRA